MPSLGLGSIAVSPLDLASGYATLAAGGVSAEPMAIRKVVLENGKEDTQAGWGVPKRKRVLSEGTAAVVTEILEDNMRYGTGTRAYFGRPAAGKTGTTDHHADAWFAGYTPAPDHGLDGLRARRDPDGERARDQRGRRHLPGRDLAPVHGARRCLDARPRVPGASQWPVWQRSSAGRTRLAMTRTPRRRKRKRDRDRARRAGNGQGKAFRQGEGEAQGAGRRGRAGGAAPSQLLQP